MTNKTSKKSAMTVMELIVYLAITMIIAVLIIELISRMLKVKSQSAGSSEVTANATFLLDKLSYGVANSSEATGTYPANTLNLTVNGQPVSFALINGQIFYQSVALTNNLVEISPATGNDYIFERLNNGAAQSIQAKFQAKYKDTHFSRDYQSTFFVGDK